MKSLKYMENVEHYNQWIATGNLDKDYIEPPRVYTEEQQAKINRKTAAKLLKDKVKNKGTLSKDELARILEALMDLIS